MSQDYEDGKMPFVHKVGCPFNTKRDYKKERKEELKNLKLVREWLDPFEPGWKFQKFSDGTVKKIHQ